ncbi:4'-phosphopantetheinyl transferase superfamily protein [Streptomyces sp. NPDC005209]|uniref:4'-phosphopantetheinyl transferase family protein n=1 Tax=Streptomyces sp. NPDC005209 TaxID=3156715 RepID=UPI0033ACCAC7
MTALPTGRPAAAAPTLSSVPPRGRFVDSTSLLTVPSHGRFADSAPRPLPGVVEVWRIPLSGRAADAALASAGQLLGADELARARRLVLREDRRRWVTARVALRTLLARRTGVAPDRITLEYGRHGKPRLFGQGADGLRFSLSHSRDRALLAVCRGAPVGADLEHLSAGPADAADLDDLAVAVLAPEELRAYLRLPPALRRAALLRRWTGKEAALKATGRGVTLPGARRLVVPDGSGTPRGLPGDWTQLRPWPGDGFTAAVTVRGRNWKLVCTDFTSTAAEDDPASEEHAAAAEDTASPSRAALAAHPAPEGRLAP